MQYWSAASTCPINLAADQLHWSFPGAACPVAPRPAVAVSRLLMSIFLVRGVAHYGVARYAGYDAAQYAVARSVGLHEALYEAPLLLAVVGRCGAEAFGGS